MELSWAEFPWNARYHLDLGNTSSEIGHLCAAEITDAMVDRRPSINRSS